MKAWTSRRSQAAFTLVELLIVVVILGILAAIAIPQFASSSEDAQVTSMQANLAVLRTQVEYYKVQHKGKYPGYPSAGGDPTAAEFENQLTLNSKSDGSTAALGTAGFTYGPYLTDALPLNPINNLNTVLVLKDADAFPAAADDSTGWVFQPKIGKLRANSTGNDPSGKAWFSY